MFKEINILQTEITVANILSRTHYENVVLLKEFRFSNNRSETVLWANMTGYLTTKVN